MTGLSKRSLVKQYAWALSGQVAQALLALASVVVIARLLGPETYGVFALVMLIVGLAEILVGGHVTDFIVQKPTVAAGDRNAAFVLAVLVALAIAVSLLIAAPFLAIVLGHRDIPVLMPAAALLVVLTAAANVPTNLLVRGMHFDILARIDATAGLAAFIVGVSLAYGGAGIWSLLVMEIVRRSLRLLLVSVAARWVPGVSFRWHNVAELWIFARSRLLGALFQYLAQATPRLVVQAMLGTHALGYFAVASRLLDQTTGLVTGPLAAIAFPAAARARGDLEQLRDLLARAIATSTAIGWPAILGFVVVAPVLIPILLGPDWARAVLTIQILTLSALRASVTGFNGAIILGLGRADLRMRLNLVNAVLGLLLCPFGALFGVEGVSAAVLVRAFISWPVGAAYVERLTGFAAKRQFRIAAISAIPAMAMAVSVEVLRRSLDGLVRAPLLGVVLIACGVIFYAGFWAALNFRRLPRIVGLASARLRRRRNNIGVGGA
ncbi:MAG TPA: oligosaccharide flippase family protein [Rhizobiaceae bacterium]|nr:oligosaccharide flippase family protein [Rhizobiaceae bacterium]